MAVSLVSDCSKATLGMLYNIAAFVQLYISRKRGSKHHGIFNALRTFMDLLILVAAAVALGTLADSAYLGPYYHTSDAMCAAWIQGYAIQCNRGILRTQTAGVCFLGLLM